MNGTSADLAPSSTPHPFAGLAYTPTECMIVIAYLTVASAIGTCANSLITGKLLPRYNCIKYIKCPKGRIEGARSAPKASKPSHTIVTSTSQHQIFDEKFDQGPESVRIKMADLAGR